MPWSRPAERMRELVQAIRAIWSAWEESTPLDFRGDFYAHTRMIPAFDPGPNRFGRPKIFTAGVGPKMTEVAGEVADGFLVHPVNTRRSLEEITVPAIERGANRAGRAAADVEIVCVTIVVTGRDEAEFTRSREAVREQLAFYGTTSAYASVFELEGYGDLHPILKAMAKESRWSDEIAAKLRTPLDGIFEVGQPGQQPGARSRALRFRRHRLAKHLTTVSSRIRRPTNSAVRCRGRQ